MKIDEYDSFFSLCLLGFSQKVFGGNGYVVLDCTYMKFRDEDNPEDQVYEKANKADSVR